MLADVVGSSLYKSSDIDTTMFVSGSRPNMISNNINNKRKRRKRSTRNVFFSTSPSRHISPSTTRQAGNKYMKWFFYQILNFYGDPSNLICHNKDHVSISIDLLNSIYDISHWLRNKAIFALVTSRCHCGIIG